jgi:hypothetical protein
MISFINGFFIAISISIICWVTCVLSYPKECETVEEFLVEESIFFVCAWIALAILALPAAIIIHKMSSHE